MQNQKTNYGAEIFVECLKKVIILSVVAVIIAIAVKQYRGTQTKAEPTTYATEFVIYREPEMMVKNLILQATSDEEKIWREDNNYRVHFEVDYNFTEEEKKNCNYLTGENSVKQPMIIIYDKDKMEEYSEYLHKRYENAQNEQDKVFAKVIANVSKTESREIKVDYHWENIETKNMVYKKGFTATVLYVRMEEIVR